MNQGSGDYLEYQVSGDCIEPGFSWNYLEYQGSGDYLEYQWPEDYQEYQWSGDYLEYQGTEDLLEYQGSGDYLEYQWSGDYLEYQGFGDQLETTWGTRVQKIFLSLMVQGRGWYIGLYWKNEAGDIWCFMSSMLQGTNRGRRGRKGCLRKTRFFKTNIF